jgi:hypothetical protein
MLISRQGILAYEHHAKPSNPIKSIINHSFFGEFTAETVL